MTVRSVLTVALLGGALLSGCGGSDGPAGAGSAREDTPATTSAVPNSQLAWVQEANTICRENDAAGERLTAEFLKKVNAIKASTKAGEVPSDADLRAAKPEALLASIMSTEHAFMKRLRAVDVPRADAGEWNTFLGHIDEALELMPAAFRNSLDDEPDPPALVDQMLDLVAKTRPYAQEHGLDDCLPPLNAKQD